MHKSNLIFGAALIYFFIIEHILGKIANKTKEKFVHTHIPTGNCYEQDDEEILFIGVYV